MTDAEALNHIIQTAKNFANVISKDMPKNDDVSALAMHCGKHILAMSIAAKETKDELVAHTAIAGLVLLLYRKDLVDKITLVNATNVKD